MRKTLSTFIGEDDYLFHADMWRFDTQAKTINFGLGESNLLNVAGGLAATGKTVYIYGVCGFIIHRYEQLKFSCRDFGGQFGKIIICNAGKYGYSHFGSGHILDDDINIMKVLGIRYYQPDHVEQFIGVLKALKTGPNGVYYIQLGADE